MNELFEKNDFVIFSAEEFKQLDKSFQFGTDCYKGVVYLVEWGDKTKIGKTSKPLGRVKNLIHIAEDYALVKCGKIAISRPHTNFSKNETIMHRYFKNARIANGELFKIGFSDALSMLKSLEFEDNSEALNAKAEVGLKMIKDLLMPSVNSANSTIVYQNDEEYVSEEVKTGEHIYSQTIIGTCSGLDLARIVLSTLEELEKGSEEWNYFADIALSIDMDKKYIRATESKYYLNTPENWEYLGIKNNHKEVEE